MGCCNKYPSTITMAKDLSRTMINAVKGAVREGKVLSSSDVTMRRLEICDGCDKKVGVRCIVCGCYISLKTAVNSARCPIKKW